MKTNIRFTALFLLSAGFILFSSGCSKSPEDAREELGAMNIQYTEDAFLDRVENNDLRAVELFITAGMNTEVLDGSPLQKATEHGHIEIVKLLLGHSADVNAKATLNWTALMAASRGGHTEIVRLLLDHGADVNIKNNIGNTALMDASRGGHAGVVELLKAAGARD